jgi:DNA-binding MarR family transcriptional regulator
MKARIQPSLCYCQASRRSSRHLTRTYDRHLAPAGISISQYAILATLERDPDLLVAELADRMVMERTTLVRALKPLRQAGYVLSGQVGSGRSLALSLSPHGLKKLAEARPLWNAAQNEFEKAFGVQRAVRLRKEMLAASLLA